MAYRVTINIALGQGHAGLTLKAQLVDVTGASVGLAVTTGFVEIGGGNYLWDYSSVPSNFRGGIKFLKTSDSSLQAFVSVSPEDSELLDHLDTDVSSRLSTAGYIAPDNATITTISLKIGTPTGASLSADIAEVEAETDDIAAVKAKTDLIPVGGPPTAAQIDAQLTGTHGSGLWDATSSEPSDPLENPVPDGYAPGTAGYVLGQLVGVEVVGSIAPIITDAGDLELIKGQDYLIQDNNAIVFSNTSGWPSLANARVQFKAFSKKLDMEVVSSIPPQIVRLSLDDVVTADLPLNRYEYEVVAQLTDRSVFVLAKGRVLFT